ATLGGAEHEYTIKEVGEEEGSIQVNGTWYGVNYGGTMTDVLTVTNKAKVPLTPLIPPTRTLKVSKIWSGIDGKAIDGPVDAITVELFKDGQTTGATLELTAANGWTSQFTNLPVSATLGGTEHEYTIKEVGEEEGSIKVGGRHYQVSYKGHMDEGFIVANKEIVTMPPLPNGDYNQKTHVEKTDSYLSRKANKKRAQDEVILPKTGDTGSCLLYVVLLLIFGLIIVIIGYRFNNYNN
ncbi:hypothetical protein J2S23_001988, partial [Streptococcus moroccensis]